MKKILVIGSTGLLGKPTTRQFIERGHDVSLLARNPEKTRQLFPECRIEMGDVFDEDSLRSAFQGKDVVYLNLSVAPSSSNKDPQQEREGMRNIIAAAKKEKVGRIAYLSSLIKNYQGMNGFDWWAFRIKNAAIDQLKNSGVPYSIFYPSTFMETFLNLIKGNNIYLVSGSHAPMWMIAAADYGKQVSKAFEIANGNQEFVIQGLEPFTWDEASKVIVENYKARQLKIKKAPIGIVKFLGTFNRKVEYGAKILTALNNYPEKFESDPAWSALGKPTITLKAFASAL